jgi:hypothetical protein
LPILTGRGPVEDYHDQAHAHGRVVRGGGNLLGGRAVRYDLLPLTSAELPDLSLDKALNRGLLPSHYLSDRASSRLAAYVGDYLREEVLAEALTRNLPAFQRFLEAAALSNGQIVNAATISREIGVAANTVRGYFDILVDTLIATWVPAWTRRTKRRVIQAPRFWFFDVGIVNEVARRGTLMPGSTDYGAAFEHFIFMELRAHATYSPRDIGLPVSYWRTASGIEVDFILGNAEVAVEVKSTDRPASDHLKGLRAWQEEASTEPVHPRLPCAQSPPCRAGHRDPPLARVSRQPLAERDPCRLMACWLSACRLFRQSSGWARSTRAVASGCQAMRWPPSVRRSEPEFQVSRHWAVARAERVQLLNRSGK